MSLKTVFRRIPIFQIICVMLAMLCIGYPVIMNAYNNWKNDQAIRNYTSIMEADQERVEELLGQAHGWNDVLNGKQNKTDAIWGWEEQLGGMETPVGYLEIESLGQRIPMYKGSNDETLMAGCGIMENGSLPVGGESTHAIIAGHSGMAGNRMFDDLEQVQLGERFTIHVLGQELTYQIYSKEVVTPDDTRSFAVQEGRDLCTLVTCTPYSINTHRLLVHGERVNVEESIVDDGVPTHVDWHRLIPALILAGIVGFGILMLFLRTRKRPMQLGHKRVKEMRDGSWKIRWKRNRKIFKRFKKTNREEGEFGFERWDFRE